MQPQLVLIKKDGAFVPQSVQQNQGTWTPVQPFYKKADTSLPPLPEEDFLITSEKWNDGDLIGFNNTWGDLEPREIEGVRVVALEVSQPSNYIRFTFQGGEKVFQDQVTIRFAGNEYVLPDITAQNYYQITNAALMQQLYDDLELYEGVPSFIGIEGELAPQGDFVLTVERGGSEPLEQLGFGDGFGEFQPRAAETTTGKPFTVERFVANDYNDDILVQSEEADFVLGDVFVVLGGDDQNTSIVLQYTSATQLTTTNPAMNAWIKENEGNTIPLFLPTPPIEE